MIELGLLEEKKPKQVGAKRKKQPPTAPTRRSSRVKELPKVNYDDEDWEVEHFGKRRKVGAKIDQEAKVVDVGPRKSPRELATIDYGINRGATIVQGTLIGPYAGKFVSFNQYKQEEKGQESGYALRALRACRSIMTDHAVAKTFGLTEKQVCEVKEAFAFFDRDADGVISTNELGRLMRCLGKMPSEAEVAVFKTKVDPDGKGSLDLSTFLELMSKQIDEGKSEEIICDAFKVFDEQGTGIISAAELRHVLTNLGEKLTGEEVDEMVREADLGGEGQFNYADFVARMDGQK